MVFVEFDKRLTAIKTLGVLQDLINEINTALKKEENVDNEYDATFVAGRNQAALDAGAEMSKVFRWYWEIKLAQAPVAAYDNAGMDANHPGVRGEDDGN
jgi:hypothetical protein